MSSDRAALQRLSILMATVFVDMVGFLMVLPLLPFYATRLGADAFMVGLMVAAFAVAQLATSASWGRLSDRYGRRPMILGGLLISAVAYLLFAFACTPAAADWLTTPGTIAVLFLSRLFQGAGGGTTGVVQAYVSDSVGPEARTKGLGWITAATSAGVMIGPAIGSIAAGFGPAAPGLFAAGLCVANAAFGFFRLPESHDATRRAAAPPQVKGAVRRQMVTVVLHPLRAVSALIWIYAVGMMAFMAMNGVLALYLKDRFAVTEHSIGYFYSFVGAVSIVMRALILGPTVRRFGERRVLRLGLLSLVAGFVLMPLAPGIPSFAAVVMLIPIGTALLFPATTSLVSRYAPKDEVGQTMGVQQAYGGVARMVGPIWAGAVFQHVSPAAPFWLSAALVAALRLFAGGLRAPQTGSSPGVAPEPSSRAA